MYEMTTLRWQEFIDMEYIVKQIHPNMSWKDCHVECAMSFHFCFNMFMYKHILNDNGILGKVKKYVICYELQHHGFVHARIILWVEEENLNIITNEITFLLPLYLMEQLKSLLFQRIVYKINYLKWCCEKNFMIIKIDALKKGWNGNCRFGFPFASHVEPNYFFNEETNK